jgi:hypothetical protein
MTSGSPSSRIAPWSRATTSTPARFTPTRVVLPERVQLEQDHEELRVLVDQLEQRLAERAEQRVGAVQAGGGVAQALHPQVAVAPDDLGEQPLLRPEVVVQEAARDAGLARDVVERGAGGPARAHAGARRVDDPLRLLA